jgi:diacylglycerol O-acyltransferase
MTPVHSGDRLAAEDAAFLYFETNDAPLHIGSVSVLEGDIPLADYVEFIASRLPLIPRYRQRLVFPPFNIGHPTWEDDPEFDIGNHIREVHLKRGTMAELQRVAGRIFSHKMDRNRPLWDLTLVHGLSDGRSAFISRVHHCLVDGVSGVGIVNVMLSVSPEIQPLPETPPFQPGPLPDAAKSLAAAIAGTLNDWVQRILSTQMAALNTAEALLSVPALEGWIRMQRLIPEFVSPPERFPFNRPVSGPRRVAWAELSISDVKAIRQTLGGTLNDVVLAAVVLAISRYVELHGQPVENRLLRLMVPVNLRRGEKDHGFGNRVSALPVNVPLDIRDPAKLIRTIQERTEILKISRIADLVQLSSSWMGLTPAPVQALLAPLAAATPAAPFNLVCTNVPGPQYPLFLLGRKMITFHPYVPIGNDLGIGWAIQSYNGVLYFGLTADSTAAPDIRRLNDFLEDAFTELRTGAGIPREEHATEETVEAPTPEKEVLVSQQ